MIFTTSEKSAKKLVDHFKKTADIVPLIPSDSGDTMSPDNFVFIDRGPLTNNGKDGVLEVIKHSFDNRFGLTQEVKDLVEKKYLAGVDYVTDSLEKMKQNPKPQKEDPKRDYIYVKASKINKSFDKAVMEKLPPEKTDKRLAEFKDLRLNVKAGVISWVKESKYEKQIAQRKAMLDILQKHFSHLEVVNQESQSL